VKKLGSRPKINSQQFRAKHSGRVGAAQVLLRNTLILFAVAVFFGAPSFAAVSEWTRAMDEGHSADIIQDFQRAEVAYKRALQFARQSQKNEELFHSTAHWLCAMIMQQKYSESEPLFNELVSTIKKIKADSQLDSDMLEEIDDLCDAYENCDYVENKHKHWISNQVLIRLDEHALELRLSYLPYSNAVDACLSKIISLQLQEKHYADAQAVIQKTLKRADDANPMTKATMELTLSAIDAKLGQKDKAKEWDNLARQAFMQTHAMCDYYKRLRWFYATIGNPATAEHFCVCAIDECKKTLDEQQLAELYYDRASDFYSDKRYVESEESFQQTIQLYKKHHRYAELVGIYDGLQRTLEKLNRPAAAAEAHALSKAAAEKARSLEKEDFHDLTGDRSLPESLRKARR
jgi:tetratricopeptide (TPR) repeat protein